MVKLSSSLRIYDILSATHGLNVHIVICDLYENRLEIQNITFDLLKQSIEVYKKKVNEGIDIIEV